MTAKSQNRGQQIMASYDAKKCPTRHADVDEKASCSGRCKEEEGHSGNHKCDTCHQEF
jgi:hypothetical protein